MRSLPDWSEARKSHNPCDVLRLADPPHRLAWVWRAGRRRGEAGISEARARSAGAIVAPLAGQHGQRAREARGDKACSRLSEKQLLTLLSDGRLGREGLAPFA